MGFVGSEGAGINGVLVLSDHPRDHEKDQNLPLRPSSRDGAIFNGLLRRIQGIERNQFLITSVTRCMPPKGWLDGAPYEFMAVEQCAHFNASLVAQRRPRAILALGALAVRTATGMSGKKQNIKMLRGFQLFASRPEYHIDGVPLPVIATYSPTFLGMGSKSRSRGGEVQSGGKVEKAEGGMGLSGVMMRDILLAKTIASRGPLALRKPRVVHGTREVMERLIRDFSSHPEWRNHFDIETPYSKGSLDESELEVGTKDLHVTAIQFTPNDQEGFVFPGFECEWVKDGSKHLLALAHQKISHNGKNFDVPVLRHHDVHLSGVHIDLQQAWSWIQPDLPKALQYVTSFYAPELGPWKHLGSDSSVYQANDVIALAINHDGIFKEMEARGLRTSFDRHVTLLGYEMSAASMRGIPIDEERHQEFGVKVGGEIQVLQAAIRAAVPEDVLLIEPKRKKDDGRFEFGFVRTPAPLVPLLEGDPDATKFIVVEEIEEPVLDDEGEPTGEIENSQDTVTYVLQESEWWEKTVDGPPDKDGVVEPLLSPPDEDGVVVPVGGLVRGRRWHRQLPFSTASVPQKIAYIRYHRDIEVRGRVSKGQDRPTAERLAKYIVPMVKNKQRKLVENSGSKELAKLFKTTGDPVFRDLVEITKLKKLFGTYGPKGWITRKGYVHSTFGLADTGTGQLSCCAPWTPVLTIRGLVPIKDVRIGDEVWTHKLRWRPVSAVWVHPMQEMMEVHLSNGEIITCTVSHRLLYSHYEHIEEVVDGREHTNGSDPVSKSRGPNSTRVDRLSENVSADNQLGAPNPNAESRVQSSTKASVFSLETREQEPSIQQAGSGVLELGGRGGGWVRVSDLLGGWKAGVRSSTCDGRGFGSGGDSRNLGCSPRQQQHEGQPVGQSSLSDPCGTHGHSLASAYGPGVVAVKKIISVGSFPVHDITVEDDESYESCGVFSHNSRDPNVQNAPKHSVLAKQFRSCVRAKEGRVLIEIDKKSFHAQTLALAAKDKAYARISAIDVHSYMTAHRLRLPEAATCLSWSDKDLTAWLKKMRKDPHVYGHEAGPAFPSGMTFDQIRDFKSKKSILGIGFNQGAGSIYEQNSEGYKSKKEVQEFLDLIFVLFAGIKQFHKDITQLAHKQTHLVSLWGYIRRFYDVFRWDHTKWNEFTGSQGDWAHGDDYEAAIAFLPANHAFGMLKEEMLMLAGYRPTPEMAKLPLKTMGDWWKKRLWMARSSENYLEKFGLINQIHDSLKFHCPLSLRDECFEVVPRIMRTPCLTLADPDMCPKGLFVDVKIESGLDWANMQEIVGV